MTTNIAAPVVNPKWVFDPRLLQPPGTTRSSPPAKAQILLDLEALLQDPPQRDAQHAQLLPRGVGVLRAQPLMRHEECEHAWSPTRGRERRMAALPKGGGGAFLGGGFSWMFVHLITWMS